MILPGFSPEIYHAGGSDLHWSDESMPVCDSPVSQTPIMYSCWLLRLRGFFRLRFFTPGALSVAAGRKMTLDPIKGSMGVNTVRVIIGPGTLILTAELAAVSALEHSASFWNDDTHREMNKSWV